jgi:predicted RNase H-like HicB family nuclease
MRYYIALIHKDADSDYGVSFPDLPGVITAVTDLDDARAMAAEALALHLEGMAADGEAVPEPSPCAAFSFWCRRSDGRSHLLGSSSERCYVDRSGGESLTIGTTMPFAHPRPGLKS